MTPIKLSSDLQRREVIKHLSSLDRGDLRLRFGYTPTEEIIEKYVTDSWERVDDRWYGIYDTDHDGIVATLHIAQMNKDTAELGFTVAEDARGRGYGDALFNRGAVWAKARAIKTLFMHCLSENKAIQHIAKKNGMHVVTLGDGEAEADLDLPYDPSAIISQAMIDQIAVYDMLFVNQMKLINNIILRKKS